MSTQAERDALLDDANGLSCAVDHASTVLNYIIDEWFTSTKPKIYEHEIETIGALIRSAADLLWNAKIEFALETGAGNGMRGAEYFMERADNYRTYCKVTQLHEEIRNALQNVDPGFQHQLEAQLKELRNVEDAEAIPKLEKVLEEAKRAAA